MEKKVIASKCVVKVEVKMKPSVSNFKVYAEGATMFVKQINPNRSYLVEHIMTSLIVNKG